MLQWLVKAAGLRTGSALGAEKLLIRGDEWYCQCDAQLEPYRSGIHVQVKSHAQSNQRNVPHAHSCRHKV